MRLLLLLFSGLVRAYFPVVGCHHGHDRNTGERAIRLPIDEFVKSGPQFDLFMLALSILQDRSQSDPLSYFQIAGTCSFFPKDYESDATLGIHGYPSIPWDNVDGEGTYPGYCPHESVLFPTWHRVYMALFEVRRDVLCGIVRLF